MENWWKMQSDLSEESEQVVENENEENIYHDLEVVLTSSDNKSVVQDLEKVKHSEESCDRDKDNSSEEGNELIKLPGG